MAARFVVEVSAGAVTTGKKHLAERAALGVPARRLRKPARVRLVQPAAMPSRPALSTLSRSRSALVLAPGAGPLRAALAAGAPRTMYRLRFHSASGCKRTLCQSGSSRPGPCAVEREACRLAAIRPATGSGRWRLWYSPRSRDRGTPRRYKPSFALAPGRAATALAG